ncbi:MAG: 30S ribosomal protein S20 [Myxococcota bacterium]
MANHPQARKRARQNQKRRAANVRIKTGVKSALKKSRLGIEASPKDAGALAREAESAIRRASSKGIIPKRRASRQIARLAKAVKRAE